MKIGNLFILGDSYSTYQGYIPEGYAVFYGVNTDTDVTCVEQTWWHQLMVETDGRLVRNSSNSGTTVCHTGYQGVDCAHVSFVGRLDKLIAQKFFEENQVDTFVVFGGTNDSWACSPVGELQYSDWKKADLYNALPAMSYLLNQVTTYVADARIIVIINTDLNEKLAEGYKQLAKHYGAILVAPEEIDKMGGHPSVKGMEQIKEAILKVI